MSFMQLPLKVDLNRLEMPSVANLLTPIVPGVVLAMGTWYVNPVIVERYFAASSVGYGVKVTAAALSGYVAGLVLSVLTETGLGLLAAVLVNTAVRFAATKITAGAWQSTAFRKLALPFLGRLAPPDEQPMSDAEYELELKKCELGVPELEAIGRKIEVLRERSRRQSIDWEWRRWYQVLGTYFRPPAGSPQASIFSVRPAAGAAAAGLVFLFSQHVGFNAVWVACWCTLAIALVQEVSILGLNLYPDVSGDDMLARMLHQVKVMEASSAAANRNREAPTPSLA